MIIKICSYNSMSVCIGKNNVRKNLVSVRTIPGVRTVKFWQNYGLLDYGV